jgi:putative hydrolase of the HAD superfamily
VTITTVFFDLDDTLYPASSGLWEAIKERMSRYMHERLGIPDEQIPALRQQLFQQYGTTLRGLEATYPINTQDYLAYVHDLRLADYLVPNPLLRSILQALPTRKLVLTNADAAHAGRVLSALGLEGCFEAIVDINAMAPYCKPQPEALAIAMKTAGENDVRRCALIDDLPHTTQAARQFGFFSILYGRDGSLANADATLRDWGQLPELLNKRERELQ